MEELGKPAGDLAIYLSSIHTSDQLLESLCHSCRRHVVGSDNGEAVQPLRVGAGVRWTT